MTGAPIAFIRSQRSQESPNAPGRGGRQHRERQHHGFQEIERELPGADEPDGALGHGAGRGKGRQQPQAGRPRRLRRERGRGPQPGEHQLQHRIQKRHGHRGRRLFHRERRIRPGLHPGRELHSRRERRPGPGRYGLPAPGVRDDRRPAQSRQPHCRQRPRRHQHPRGAETPREGDGNRRLPVQPGFPRTHAPSHGTQRQRPGRQRNGRGQRLPRDVLRRARRRELPAGHVHRRRRNGLHGQPSPHGNQHPGRASPPRRRDP